MYQLSKHIYLKASMKFPTSDWNDEVYHFSDVYSFSGYNDFSQSVDVETGETIDFILSQTINKPSPVLGVIFKSYTNSDGKRVSCYSAFDEFKVWFARFADTNVYKLTLIVGYGDGNSASDSPFDGSVGGRRMDIAISSISTDGLMSGGCIKASISFKAISPVYTSEESHMLGTAITDQLKYNYTYPYTYGSVAIGKANVINNTYIKPIPIRVEVSIPKGEIGEIVNPLIALHTGQVGSGVSKTYSYVQFKNLKVCAGDTLILDSSLMVAYIVRNGISLAVYDYIDKSSDSFLYANHGESNITLSMDETSTASRYSVLVKYILYRI